MSICYSTRPANYPGLGAGVRPPILDESLVDDFMHVSEPDAIRLPPHAQAWIPLRRLHWNDCQRRRILAGQDNADDDLTAVAIASDLVERDIELFITGIGCAILSNGALTPEEG